MKQLKKSKMKILQLGRNVVCYGKLKYSMGRELKEELNRIYPRRLVKKTEIILTKCQMSIV